MQVASPDTERLLIASRPALGREEVHYKNFKILSSQSMKVYAGVKSRHQISNGQLRDKRSLDSTTDCDVGHYMSRVVDKLTRYRRSHATFS